MHEDAEKLIPDLQQWNNGAGIDLGGFLSAIARYDEAIAYATVFWPDFVLYDDCVLLHRPDEKNYQDWIIACKGDKTKVEGMMNHRHIVDIFLNSQFKPTKRIVLHIGRLLQDMWSCKLQRDFLDRRFKVEFVNNDSDDLIDYQITVFQERK